jgi:hypothetical protein
VRAALAAAVALLALTGCVQAAQPPAEGASLEQREARAVRQADLLWQISSFADQQPANQPHEFISQSEWADAIVGCMTAAGYEGYVSDGTGYSFESSSGEAESVMHLTCSSQWVVLPTEDEMLGDAQLSYLYDYYQQELIPCLTLAGFRVTSAPTRTEFVESRGEWIPQMTMEGPNANGFDVGSKPWYRSSDSEDPLNPCVTWPPEWDYLN